MKPSRARRIARHLIVKFATGLEVGSIPNSYSAADVLQIKAEFRSMLNEIDSIVKDYKNDQPTDAR